MRDFNNRRVGGDAGDALVHTRLGGRVDLAGGLVEDIDGCVSQERTCQGQALTLAAREAFAHVTNDRVQAILFRGQPVGKVHGLQGAIEVLIGGIGCSEEQVGAQRVVKQVGALGRVGDRGAQVRQGGVGDVRATDSNRTRGRIPRAGEQRGKRRLARSGGTHDSGAFSGGNADVDAIQDGGGRGGRVLIRRVGEGYVADHDVARGQRHRVGRICDGRGAVGDRKDTGGRGKGLIQVGGELFDSENRAEGTHGDADGQAHLGQGQGTAEVFGTRDHGDGDDAGGHGSLVESAAQGDPAALDTQPGVYACLDVIHLGLASLLRAKCQDLAHALHRVGDMGGERASGVAQLAGRAGGRTRSQERDDRSNNDQEGSQDGGDRPGHGGAHPHERQDRHNDGRGDGGERVGEENLDAVDVLRHAVHDVARIQAVRARGGLRFKLVVEVVA